MGRNKTLDESNIEYCKRICNKVERFYLKPHIKDYPAMAVTAEFSGNKSEAHSCPGYRIKLDTRSYIETILGGKVGTKSHITKCKNPIGNCAEQHVSDYLTRKTLKTLGTIDYKKIKFSQAIRPRTMESHPKCENCELLFE